MALNVQMNSNAKFSQTVQIYNVEISTF